MLLRSRWAAPSGFIEPCLPSSAERPPSGPGWIHEIKHDGYRLMARRDPIGIRLLTRNGHDWALRYPLIVEAVDRLKVRSCLIDGEAVACDDNGIASFDLIRHHRANDSVFLYAFDLIELNGDDLRRDPLEVRKAYAGQSWPWPALQRAFGRRRPDHLRPCLQDGARGYRVEAARIAVPIWPIEGLAQVQEPGRACSEARGRGGVGQGALAMTDARGVNRIKRRRHVALG
jgi:ATP dependent DNA ligase-like protein